MYRERAAESVLACCLRQGAARAYAGTIANGSLRAIADNVLLR